MRCVRIIIIVCIISLSVACAGAQQAIREESTADDTMSYSIDSEFVNIALEYTGFEKMEGFDKKMNLKSVEYLITQKDETPYLHSRINDHKIICVTFENIQLAFKRRLPQKLKLSRVFKIYIDPVNRQFLKIESRYSGPDKYYSPEPSAKQAEKQLTDNNEIYLDFVNPSDTCVSFLDAIDRLSPLDFKEVSANLIVLSSGNFKYPIPVWSVTFRGIKTDKNKSSDQVSGPLWSLDYARFVYNAKTGELLFTTNMPSPDSE